MGVLTAEIDPSTDWRVSEDAGALARLLASQMAPLLAALAPFPPSLAKSSASYGGASPLAWNHPRATAGPARRHRSPRNRPRAIARPAPPHPCTLHPCTLHPFSLHPCPSSPVPVAVRVAVEPSPAPVPALAPAPAPALAPPAAVPGSSDDDAEASLREARGRFIAGFRKRCAPIDELIAEVEEGAQGPIVALRQIVHRLSGLAVVVGLPTVGARALELDRLLATSPVADIPSVREAFDGMQDAFAADLAAMSRRGRPHRARRWARMSCW